MHGCLVAARRRGYERTAHEDAGRPPRLPASFQLRYQHRPWRASAAPSLEEKVPARPADIRADLRSGMGRLYAAGAARPAVNRGGADSCSRTWASWYASKTA